MGVILLVAIVLYAPVLAPGRALLPSDLLLITPPWAQQSRQLDPDFTHVLRRTWDPLFQFYPSRKFLAESLSHGFLPLWDPHAFAGTPFAGDGQSAVFYPINWLFALTPLAYAFALVAFLHSLLTGIFMYLYGRRVGWSAAGAVAAAVVWMLCGVQVGWQMWQVVDSTLCWLPLCLYFWEGVRTRRSVYQSLGLAGALALTFLAGHLQFAFYVFITTMAYAVYRPVQLPGKSNVSSFLSFCGCGALGLALSAVQIAATTDFLRLSIRISIPIAQLLPTALPATQLGLLAIPGLFGREQDYLNHCFLAGEYYEKVVYCGASALVFAAFALRLRRPGDLSRYWCGLAVFALLMGCGTPLYAAFYYAVPLYKSFHGLSRAFVLFDFAVAAQCGQGITLLGQEPVGSRKRTVQIAGGFTIAAIIVTYRLGILNNGNVITFFLTHDWLTYGLAQVGMALGLAFAAAIMLLKLPKNAVWVASALVVLDMLYFACGINPGGNSSLLYPATPETTYVTSRLALSPFDRVLCISDGKQEHPQSRITPNGAMSLGWNDVSGSNPLILSRYNSFIGVINIADTNQLDPSGQGMIAEPGNPALDWLNVRWVVAPRTLSLPNYRLTLAGNVDIYENTAAKGAAWLLPMSELPLLHDSIREDQLEFLHDSNLSILLPNPSVKSNSPGRLTVKANTAFPSALVISQTYCPGWQAIVDNKLSNLFVVGGVFPAVTLPAGSHNVVLSYVPTSVKLGLFITSIAWLILFFRLTVALKTRPM